MTSSPDLHPDGQQPCRTPAFAAMGWTQHDWDNLADPATWDTLTPVGHSTLQAWLTRPPTPHPLLGTLGIITPTEARAAFTRYDHDGMSALRAAATGASTRFITAILCPPGPARLSPAAIWRHTHQAGLTEHAATGWAHTRIWATGSDQTKPMKLAVAWANHFGQAAYLWVLAGYDLAEAEPMQDAGTTPSETQLRVMAALNGCVLPAGI